MSPTLAAGAREMGVVLSEAQLSQVAHYAAALTKWNQRYNFISRQDIGRLIPRHLLDSLSGLPYLEHGPVLDVGTGPGLPGILLAIAQPEIEFVLCDRSERRIRFVQQMVQQLELSNVQAECADLADLQHDACFQTVVARALAPVEVLYAQVHKFLCAQGWLLVYAQTGGSDPEEASHPDAVTRYHSVSIPGLAQRHRLVQRFRRDPSLSGSG
ncbi:MAG: 16S rRNA (guanine(527)-N(7))-methyltransferase RsmG [Pseudomonadota bacterium]